VTINGFAVTKGSNALGREERAEWAYVTIDHQAARYGASMSGCLACGEVATIEFVDGGLIPVQCTALHDERDAALAAPKGEMRLVLCPTCATVTNAAFDADLVAYDGDYENSQLFSATFRDFASDLAKRLVADHHLVGASVVEVGSGKAEFLAMLAEAGAGRATGYDPTYGGEIDHLDPDLDIHLVRTMFDESTVGEPPALVCSRHVLEHLADPVAMLGSIHSAVHANPSCAIYVEVPNAAFTFTPAGLWDIIYQHCSYFSAVSLEWVVRAAGFDVVDLRPAFAGQFLSIEAVPTGVAGAPPGLARRVDDTVADLLPFASEYRELVEQWRRRIGDWATAGRRVALWGGGAKGVTFLNMVGQEIDAVIDVNERKQGRFLPGTGHQVEPPEALRQIRPDVVVVMNAVYEAEIRTGLAELGLSPEIAVV
jgi:hypothetical protein